MSYTNFDRHQTFNMDMMAYHSTTIRNVEEWLIQNDKPFMNNLTNMLYGIWDGYLYDQLLPEAKQMNLPIELIKRIETTIEFIEYQNQN